MSDPTKQTADALLDFYAAFEASEDMSLQEAAFNTALARFNEVGAFRVAITGEDSVDIDIDPLLLASGITTMWLVEQLSMASNRSKEEILFDLREFIANR